MIINKDLFKKINFKKGKKDIDIVVFVSGGKDSSFAWYVATKNVNNPQRVLAVTIDNGFLSNGTKENIAILQKKLNTKHEYWQINKKTLFNFYKELVKKGPQNPRVVCVGCNILLSKMEYEILNKYRPTFFATGNNFAEYSMFKQWLVNAGITSTGSNDDEFEYRHGLWKYNLRILEKIFKSNSSEYKQLYVPEPKINNEISKIERINIFQYYKYDFNQIFKELKSIGWKLSEDVAGTETDCLFPQAIIKAIGRKEYKNKLDDMLNKNKISIEFYKNSINSLPKFDSEKGTAILKSVGYSQKNNKNVLSELEHATNDLLDIR